MRIRKQILVASLTVVGVVAGIAGPASAADTATTFSLTGGTLTLSAGANAVLTPQASSVAANTITGTLGTVTVTDARGGTDGWIASAASTTFTGDLLSVSTGVAYTNGTVTETGTNTVAAVTGQSITTAAAVATTTGVSGNNTASWNPTLDVTMPAGALADAYRGTVTTSVL